MTRGGRAAVDLAGCAAGTAGWRQGQESDPVVVAGGGACHGRLVGAATPLWYGLSHVTDENAEGEGDTVPVLAKVGGYVTAVNVQDNQRVKAGDTLVRIDDRDYNARLKQARGTLAALQAQCGGTEGHTGQAVAQVTSARAQARFRRRRGVAVADANADKARREMELTLQEMADFDYVSQQQLDSAEAAAKAADADVIAAKQAARRRETRSPSPRRGCVGRTASCWPLRPPWTKPPSSWTTPG